MKVVSQSKNREVEIPDDTPMLLAEESKRVRSFRNAKGVHARNGEYFFEGDLWRIEKIGEEQKEEEKIEEPRHHKKQLEAS